MLIIAWVIGCALTGSTPGAESALAAFIDLLPPWRNADYVAETHTVMWVIGPDGAAPLSVQWHVHRTSTVRRRGNTWTVNVTDTVEQDGATQVERFGFSQVDRLIWYTERAGSGLRVSVSSDVGRGTDWSIGALCGTAIFDGYLPSNGAEIAQLASLDSGKNKSIESVSESPAVVHCWLAGAMPRRLEVAMGGEAQDAIRSSSPAGARATVGASVLRYDVTVDDIDIETIDGNPIITHAFVTERWLYDNGVFVLYTHQASRNRIDLDPPPLAGLPIDLEIPDGTEVYEEALAAPMYQWRGGRLVLTLDDHLANVVRTAVDRLVASIAKSGRIDRVELEPIGAPTERPWHEPYCGIFSLYAAARLEHRNVDLEALVDQRYVSSPHGSSIRDLVQAAAVCGLHARPVRNLKARDLRATGRPTILHVKRGPSSAKPDHFVLFCPTSGNGAAVVDMPRGVYPLTEYDLAGLWNGVGVLISEAAIPAGLGNASSFPLRWWRRAALTVAVAVLAALTWHRLRRPWQREAAP